MAIDRQYTKTAVEELPPLEILKNDKTCGDCPFYDKKSIWMRDLIEEDGKIPIAVVWKMLRYFNIRNRQQLREMKSNACHIKHPGIPINQSINNEAHKDCVGLQFFKTAVLKRNDILQQ